MNQISDNLKDIIYKLTLGALLLILTVLFSGCSANYGRLKLSTEVEKTFENAVVLPDHKYYYSGGDARPMAILAIQNSYKLRTSLWKEVDLDPERLKNWILLMTELRGYSLRTFGSRVLDPEGKQLGIWYSAWNRTPVKMLGENEVAVYPPMSGTEVFHSYLEAEWRTWK